MRPLVYLNLLTVIVGTLTVSMMVIGDGEPSRSLTVEGGFAMRTLVYLVGLVVIIGTLVLAAIGVLNVRSTSDEVNVSIDKKELKQKTEQAAESVKEAGEHVFEGSDEPSRDADRAKDKLKPKPSDDAETELVPQ